MKTVYDALRMVAAHEAEAKLALQKGALNVDLGNKVVAAALHLAAECYRKAADCCELAAEALEAFEGAYGP